MNTVDVSPTQRKILLKIPIIPILCLVNFYCQAECIGWSNLGNHVQDRTIASPGCQVRVNSMSDSVKVLYQKLAEADGQHRVQVEVDMDTSRGAGYLTWGTYKLAEQGWRPILAFSPFKWLTQSKHDDVQIRTIWIDKGSEELRLRVVATKGVIHVKNVRYSFLSETKTSSLVEKGWDDTREFVLRHWQYRVKRQRVLKRLLDEASESIAGIQNPEDLEPIWFRLAKGLFDIDGHSNIGSPSTFSESDVPATIASPLRIGHDGCILVVSFSEASRSLLSLDRQARSAALAQGWDDLKRHAEQPHCAWALDLRRYDPNPGSLSASFAVLAPLLPLGDVGRWSIGAKGGRQDEWRVEIAADATYASSPDGQRYQIVSYSKVPPPIRDSAVVFMLTAKGETASTLEGIVLAFHGRSRCVGAATAGRATVNDARTLVDGTVLSLTVGDMGSADGYYPGRAPIPCDYPSSPADALKQVHQLVGP